MSKRLLWVGEAAYPLQNVARVYTQTIHPRRRDATMRFFRRTVITASVVSVIWVLSSVFGALSGSDGGSSESGGGDGPSTLAIFSLVVGAIVVLHAAGELLTVLSARPCFVLTVETSGPSTAVVTSQNPDQLRQLVLYIVHAIENPQAEFQVKVQMLTISPRNYYFGDNVNMYGGEGNVGIANA